MPLAIWCPIDESQAFSDHVTCYMELLDVISELYGVVSLADMPWKTKNRLAQGLSHLQAHLETEGKMLLSNMQDRVN